jgi:hypothetical protein
MKRRTFFQRLLGGLGLAAVSPVVVAEGGSLLIQGSPVAGFQFHRGDIVWPFLTVGAPLELMREPNNSHDTNAVAVYYHDHKLGYVPRGDNSVIAQMLDRGESLKATIIQLSEGEDPWERIHFNISLV